MTDAELEEVTMLLRAQLASTKGLTSIRELTKDFYELNGSNIPYRKFGFSTLIDFLRSHPDKFHVVMDHATNEPSLRPVIDSDMAGLHRLVSGQKSKKKKKSASKMSSFRPTKKPTIYANRFHTSNHAIRAYNSYDNYNQKPTTTYVRNFNFNSKPPIPPNHQYNKNYSNSIRPNVNGMYSSKQAATTSSGAYTRPSATPQLFSPALSIRSNVSQEESIASGGSSALDADIQSLFITNASYFLKEHKVFVSNIEDCHRFYIRLEGSGFSDEYGKLFQRMDAYYSAQNMTMRLKDIDRDQICVAVDASNYYRVQIKKISVDKVECFFLDEGRTALLNKNALFKIKNEFLKTEFQAILVNIDKFSEFYQNEYLFKSIQSLFAMRSFCAKRVSVTPLVIGLYNKNNECVSEIFYNNHINFVPFKPIQGMEFSACITFMSDETKDQVYLQNPYENDRFTHKMNEVNDYYSSLDESHKTHLNLTTRRRIAEQLADTSLSSSRSDQLYCGKWEVDGKWYRVKFVRELAKNSNKAVVFFVDFGNREIIDYDDLLIIPEKFELFANLPYQCLLATIVNPFDDLREIWTEGYFFKFEVTRVNPTGMPELRYIQIHASPVKLEAEIESELESPSSNDTELDSGSRIVPEDDEEDKQLAQKMNELQLVDEEKNWRQVDVPKTENLDEPMIDLPHSSLNSSDLKIKSFVNVRALNNPSDFVITLVEEGADYENMLIQMKIFYNLNSDNQIYKASNLKINNVYVARRSEDSSFARVRLYGIFPENKGLKCYDLDYGSYSIYDSESIFYITKRFLKLKPLAIKAQLGVRCDQDDRWSVQAKDFFQHLIDNNKSKVFEASMKTFDARADAFKIDLAYGSVSMIDEMSKFSMANRS